MKKSYNVMLASSLAGILLALQGCSSDSRKEPAQNTYPRFDVMTSDLPFNTDLIFAKAAQSDGTADLGTATDPVRTAMNQMDGFSTSAFFDVMISGSIAPDSARAGQTVFLLELDSGNADALDLANIQGIAGQAEFDVHVVSLDGESNNAIRLLPTKPLKPKTKYLVVLTNDLKNSAGAPLTRSWFYETMRNSPANMGALTPVKQAITAWDTLASNFLAGSSNGALSAANAKNKLVLAYTFTTTNPLTPLIAMAAPRSAIASAQISTGVTPSAAVTAATQLEQAGLLSTPKARPLGIASQSGIDFNNFSAALAAGVGTLYTGYIKLPYYQTAAPGLPAGEYLQRNWKPDLTLANAMSKSVPADVDGSHNTTYRYPFAQKTGDESIPLQVTMPKDSWVPGYAGSANCSQIYATTGYPTVIYVHGITSDRTSVIALAHTMASRCIATVAIDLPVHGVPANSALVNSLNVEKSLAIPFSTLYGANAPHERHYNIAGVSGSPTAMNFTSPGTNDGSGTQFINLAYLTNTRDNLRQSVMDLLNLNASLGAIDTEIRQTLARGLDVNRVYVIGSSLGGIVGSVFTTVNQLAIANDAQAGLSANLNPIRGLITSGAGSQVAQILANSPTFSPVINAGLANSGVAVGTTSYERFLYAAQNAMDVSDPVNFSQSLATLGVPVLVQQINNDAVIPNYADGAPLMGTRALAKLLGTTQLGLGSTPLGRGYTKLTAGGHSSLLRSEGNAPQVTAELQAQAITFILNNGNVSVGSAAPGNIELPSN